jgi:membrane protein DedA with SNARE-associated domain
VSDAILHFADELMSSWWIYLALLGFAALDGFLPAIPSETLVVTAGVFAASTGRPNLYAVIVVAAIGAFIGDHVSYALGRGAGGRLLDRVKPGTKRHAAIQWAGARWRSAAAWSSSSPATCPAAGPR